MKVVILTEVEKFCKEHNFQMVGLQTLREMAVDDDSKGRDKAHKQGYAEAHDAVVQALARSKP